LFTGPCLQGVEQFEKGYMREALGAICAVVAASESRRLFGQENGRNQAAAA
jgi:hypothetical protein